MDWPLKIQCKTICGLKTKYNTQYKLITILNNICTKTILKYIRNVQMLHVSIKNIYLYLISKNTGKVTF